MVLCALSLLADDFKVKKLVSVYDGDTFKVNLDCNEPIFCNSIPVRVYGIDTEEIKTKSDRAHQAKEFTSNFLNEAKTIYLKNCNRDKYFRINCEVLNEMNESVSRKLLESDLAYEYCGGTKKK
jgi:endonuclease YncB( thermonuclease family)